MTMREHKRRVLWTAVCGVIVQLTTHQPSAFGTLARLQAPPSSGETTFVVDGNRMYAELQFVRPSGSIHRALAFVDMGSEQMTVREALAKDLQLARDRSLTFKIGDMPIVVPGTDVVVEPRAPSSLGSRLAVEAVLPASVLQRFEVVIDYRLRKLVVAGPGGVVPQGVGVPFLINPRTGLIAVDVSVDGQRSSITIDNGSAYTWIRPSTGQQWLASHPEWLRGIGAVGVSNMTMSGDGAEAHGTLLRIPELSIGTMTLKNVGALAAGPGKPIEPNLDLFDWYSRKNPVAVIGWLGGNVLKGYRLTIDYPNRMMYWLEQRAPDVHDLDQVGLTLRADGGAFFVSGIATKNGKPTVDGVRPGDKLIRIGALDLSHATWGTVFTALHGKPGDIRQLTIEREGRSFTIGAAVTAF